MKKLTIILFISIFIVASISAATGDKFAGHPKKAKVPISPRLPADESSQSAGKDELKSSSVDIKPGRMIATAAMQLCGDVNGNGTIGVDDFVYLADYLYRGGPAPPMTADADLDMSGSINAADLQYLTDFLFDGGTPPCSGGGGVLPTGSNSITLGCPVTVETPDGDSVAIPIYITTDTPIRGLSLGFQHNSPDVEITSVSFEGSVLQLQMALGSEVDLTNNEVIIYWHNAWTDLSPQSDGLLATLWMQVPVSTPNQSVDIDSAFIAPGVEFLLCTEDAHRIYPAYTDCGTGDVVIGTPQAGDVIATAIPIGSLPFSVQGSTVGYNDDYYEICPYGGEGAPDVVYSYQPAAVETVGISLCDEYTDYDTKLFVYNDNLDLVACNDDHDDCTDYRSQLDCVIMSPDTVYYIVVDGYGANEGNYQIDMYYDLNCGPCEVTCPPGGIAESEACGDDTNGGCNMDPPSFEPISRNQIVCGTIFADGGTRDTDWYELVLSTRSFVTWKGCADFPFVVGFVDTSDCDLAGSLDPYAMGGPCDTVSCSRVAGPGVYYLFVSSQEYNDYPCGTANTYWAEVQTTMEPGDYVRLGTDSIPAGTQGYELQFYWERTCPNPAHILGFSNGFEFSTTGDASFTYVDIIPFAEHMEWFELGGLLHTNGLPDWYLVGGAAMFNGMPIFSERDFFTLVLNIGEGEGQICIDSAFVGAAGQWRWSGLTCGQGSDAMSPLFLSKDSNSYSYPICITVYSPWKCGDADGSEEVDIDDVVYLIAYIFAGGPPPMPIEAGDADCSGEIDIDDVVYLIAYIFAGGPAPCDPDNNGVPDC